MRKAALLACGLCAMLALETPSAQQPTFRSGTNLVEVTVVVRDAKGNFVSDLTIGDFEVTEDGRLQEIQTIYVARPPRAGVPALDNALPPYASGGERTSERTFIFLFDMEHLLPGSLTRARDAVEKFVVDRLTGTDLAGVIAVGGPAEARVTSDHRQTTEAVRRLKARGDVVSRTAPLRVWPRIANEVEALQIASEAASARNEALQRAARRACAPEESPGGCDTVAVKGYAAGAAEYVEAEIHQKAVMFAREVRAAALRSISGLEQVAERLAAVPGRKTVVWISEGTFSDELLEKTRNVAFRAARSGVAIYALDPRGLGRHGGGSTGARDVDDSNLQSLLGMQDDGPDFLATGTGGLAIRNENNLGRALQTIENDTSTYYVLGYAARPGGDRDEFRRIRVTVKRKGLDVRARHGYVASRAVTRLAAATPPAPAAKPVDLDAPIPLLRRDDEAILRTLDVSVVAPGAEVTGGRVVAVSAAASSVMRMRPDAAARVRELAEADETDAVTSSGAHAGALAAAGWAAYQRGELESAIGPLEEAGKDPDARPWVLYALGLAQAGLGRPADAVATWERVREAAPAFAPVYTDLAATYSHMADLGSALGVLRAAGERWPTDPEVHNAIGVIYVRRGAIDSAIAAFEQAVKVAPDDPLGYFNLGRAYEMRYARGGRFISSQRRWVMPTADRDRAIEYYREYVRRGGPYENDARDALLRLQWSGRGD